MNKKILSLVLLLFSILAIFFIFEINENKLSSDLAFESETLVSANDPGIRLLGNMTTNANLNYEITDSIINGWQFGVFNQVHTQSTITARNGAHYVNITGPSGYGFYHENPVGKNDFHFIVPTGQSTNGAKNIYGYLASVHTGLEVNEEYIVRVEGYSDSSYQLHSGIAVNKTASLEGEMINYVDYILSRNPGVQTLRFTSDVDTVSINIKSYLTNSQNFAYHRYRNISVYKFAEYNVQDLVYKLYNSSARTELNVSNLDTIETQLIELETYLANNEAKIRNEIKDEINPYIAQVREIVDIKNTIKNAYVEGSETAVKSTVTQAQITELRTRATATTYQLTRAELLNRINSLELNLRRQTRITSLTDLYNNLDSQINGLNYLNETEKNVAKLDLKARFDEEEGKIRNSTTLTNIDNAYNAGVIVLNNKYLEKHKLDAQNELSLIASNYTTEINNLTPLEEARKGVYVDLLTTELNEKKTSINNATTTSDVEQFRTEGKSNFTEIRLNAERANGVADITQHRDQILDKINAYTFLTSSEKQVYIDALQEILSRRSNEINNASPISEIEPIVVAAKLEMDVELIKAEKEDSIKALRAFKTEKENSINSNPNYSVEEKTNKVNELDTILSESETAVGNQNTLEDIKREKERGLERLAQNDLSSSKTFLKGNLQTILVEEKAKIEGLQYLTQSEKDAYKAELDARKANGDQAIDEATTLELANNAFDIAAERLRNLTIEAKRNNSKKELDEAISNFESQGGTLTPEISAKLADVKQRIDGSNTDQEMSNLVTEGKNLLVPQSREEIDRSLNRLREYFDNQKQTHKFKSNDMGRVNDLYDELYDKIDRSELSYENAKNRLAEVIKKVTDLTYEVNNTTYDIYDEQVEYPENSENTVYAGIRSVEGFKTGTTLDISKANITDAKRDELIKKLNSGTLTIPIDSTLTPNEVKERLQEMEYLRLISIELKNTNGSNLTDFEGLYLVNILIPTEYRDYAEFLVVFETTNGLEIFKTYRNKAWLTFETQHFSDFYILGLEDDEADDEGLYLEVFKTILPLVLASITLLLIIIIIIVYAIKRRNVNVKANSFTFLFIVLFTRNIEIIFIALMLCIVILTFSIINIYKTKKNSKNK